MKWKYTLAPEAARDLVQIWRYVQKQGSWETADRVESIIREKFKYLAEFPNAGHWRRDLTGANVRFYPVYSYLIVYRPESSPLQIVSILHASRDVPRILAQRP